jgi:hypothetical protein
MEKINLLLQIQRLTDSIKDLKEDIKCSFPFSQQIKNEKMELSARTSLVKILCDHYKKV